MAIVAAEQLVLQKCNLVHSIHRHVMLLLWVATVELVVQVGTCPCGAWWRW